MLTTPLLISLFITLPIALCFWFINLFGPVQKGVIGFFHPFADGGGGGERVLWCAIQALQNQYPNYKIAIFVREGVQAEQLVKDSAARFNVAIDKSPIRVVHLRNAARLLPEHYPSFTMARQAIASVQVAFSGLRQLVPEVFVDTTGWAFPYPLASLAGSKVACYVHYPTVSSDMLESVRRRQTGAVHNAVHITRSRWRSLAKLSYYRLLARVYGWCGRRADVAMANSNWTINHVKKIWGKTLRPICLVFPPVDTVSLTSLDTSRGRVHGGEKERGREAEMGRGEEADMGQEKGNSEPKYSSSPRKTSLISINQFRPEKNHALQIEAFALAKQLAKSNSAVQKAVLRLVGGSRDASDAARVESLRTLAEKLKVADQIEWYVNAPYSELRRLLGEAAAGLHSMRDEHFGIGVVEYMAAGAVAIAHNSGGPKSDIVTVDGVGKRGYLAETPEEYANSIIKVLSMTEEDWCRIASAGQESSRKFSTQNFQRDFIKGMGPILKKK